MRKGKKYQTKHKMFVSYVCIPVVILTVISCLFSFLYDHMTRERVLNFENSITENVDSELKNLMDNHYLQQLTENHFYILFQAEENN